MSLLLPSSLKAPDHLQDRAETGTLRPPDVHTPGGNGPAHRLPDPRRYQIWSWATRFMRSASAMLIGFCAMALRFRLSCTLLALAGLSVLRRPGDRLPRNARRGGGATPGGGGAMGFSPPASASLCALRPPPAHLPGPAGAVPLVLCGKPWGNIETQPPPPLQFRPVMQVCTPASLPRLGARLGHLSLRDEALQPRLH